MSGGRVLTLRRRQRRLGVALSATPVWLGNRRIGHVIEHRHGCEAVPVGGLSLGLYNDLGAAARATRREHREGADVTSRTALDRCASEMPAKSGERFGPDYDGERATATKLAHELARPARLRLPKTISIPPCAPEEQQQPPHRRVMSVTFRDHPAALNGRNGALISASPTGQASGRRVGSIGSPRCKGDPAKEKEAAEKEAAR
jgi:hypothetical protein